MRGRAAGRCSEPRARVECGLLVPWGRQSTSRGGRQPQRKDLETKAPLSFLAAHLSGQATDQAEEMDDLRALLLQTQAVRARARERLDALQRKAEVLASSSRKGFLKSLEEQVGPPPEKSWRDELLERAALVVEWSNPLSDEWTPENAAALLDGRETESLKSRG